MATAPLIDDETLDRLMGQIDSEGLELLGPDGVLTELTSRIMNRALETEMTHHLGYERGDTAGWGSGNLRNGSYPKTVMTDAGGIPLQVPRDRQASFEPALVPKHQRRLSGFNDLVIGLVARGMTTRDVQAHIGDVYDVEVSAELVSKITDAVLPELREWQQRPLQPGIASPLPPAADIEGRLTDTRSRTLSLLLVPSIRPLLARSASWKAKISSPHSSSVSVSFSNSTRGWSA